MLGRLRDNPRACLALLSRCCKRGQTKQYVAARWQIIAELLGSDDGKTRKNAAVLLGMLDRRESATALLEALAAEQQLFVRPSMILALGAIGGSQARECIQALPLPAGDDKHSRAEADAITKALSRLAPARSRSFIGLPGKTRMMLSPVSGLFDSLLHEASGLGIKLQKHGGLAALETDDYASVYRMRCFHQAMLPVAYGVDYTPQAIARVCSGKLFGLLGAMHNGEGTFSTRLELRNPPADRAAFASDFFHMAKGYTNSPSGYDIELRAVGTSDKTEGNKADLFCLLHTYEDQRFAYRQGSVPASINPSAAAAALRLGMRRFKPDARVLDPFCGSGTMLIERSILSECSALHGVDISKDACRIARQNARAAGVDMPVYNRDIIGFQAGEKYDEIICNMPFGNRVGSHSANERLYASFFSQLPTLLKPGGFALCITTEKALLRRCASGLKLALELPFSYGGLNPCAFILVC